MSTTTPLFAVDTNFLMGLVEPPDAARDALAVIRERFPRSVVLAPERVLDEIANFLATPSLGKQGTARKASVSMIERGIQPGFLGDLQATYAESIASKLLEQGVLPWEERNDAVILAEASLLNCQILISSDRHLLDIEPARLALALQERGGGVVVVCSPQEITRRFAGRSR